MSNGTPRPAYSFVVDAGSLFAYQAWHLAHSLMSFCSAEPTDIHVQFTERACHHARNLFEESGFKTYDLTRFGDGKFCNKIAQLQNLGAALNEIIVLLDTDTIAVSDLRHWISDKWITAKIVDAANPPIDVLQEIAATACLPALSPIALTDNRAGHTYVGNCNGGMYAIPRRYTSAISSEWRRWALWLLDNLKPLQSCGREIHVDQVSFWLALLSGRFPFLMAPSNANYFVHMDAPHHYFDDAREIALLHYHGALNVVGLIDPGLPTSDAARRAVGIANHQIGRAFHNTLFWDFRYDHFSERGSGIGSRGDNCEYKRNLLCNEGIEFASSILDVGCGDLEVVRSLALRNYVGLDVSLAAIDRARRIMPEGDFRLGLHDDTPSADCVLCLEVLIHQRTLQDYRRLIRFLADRTQRMLVVSGYTANADSIERNSMVYFHEPLADSLAQTGRFRNIRKIGAHTDVAVYRCDV